MTDAFSGPLSLLCSWKGGLLSLSRYCNKLLAVNQQPEVGVKAQEKECEGNTAEWRVARSKW